MFLNKLKGENEFKISVGRKIVLLTGKCTKQNCTNTCVHYQLYSRKEEGRGKGTALECSFY